MNFQTVVVVVGALSFASLCAGQGLGVAGHNEKRSKHHSQDIAADAGLVAQAQACAEDYVARDTIDHKCAKELHKGENLYKSGGMSADPEEAIARAIESWYGEIKNYNFNDPGNKKGVTGHFTQLVWDGSTKVGCGVASAGENVVAACLYDPQGNMGNGNAGADYYEFYKQNVKAA